MVSDDLLERARALQETVLSRLASGPPSVGHQRPELLKRIKNYPIELLKFALGDFGVSLGSFVKTLDLDHPECHSVSELIFGVDGSFAKNFMDFLSIAEFSKQNSLDSCFPFLGKTMVKEYINKSLYKKLESGQIARSYIRLVQDAPHRQALRKSKNTQIIDLQMLSRKGDDFWNAQCDNFDRFIRFDSAYEKEIETAERKRSRYEEMGCTTLASEIARSIGVFRENAQHAYYGFNRVTMTSVAVILAKFLGYRYVEEKQYNIGGHSYTSESRIVIDQSCFGDYRFAIDRIVSGLTQDEAMGKILGADHVYRPKIYSYQNMIDLAPDGVRKIVDTLESFPEANGKPVFDHFGVIVPSVIYSESCFRDSIGLIRKIDDMQELSVLLDRSLVKTKSVIPVLIGERDNKCYFISLWV